MPETFSRAAFTLDKGQVSEPIRSPSGVHLITILDIKPGTKTRPHVEAQLRPAVTEVGTMRVRLEREFAPVFLAGRVVAASGALALLLAAVGLYGVLVLVVAQRTRDIGIRMALGSSRRRVVGLVLRDSLGLAGVALLPGLAAAVAASRALGHYLYGVGPGDPAAFAAALAAVAAIAGLASWWPARRASRVDPLVALRHL
jgi:ABC-type antimicrobial peptide transport system permease subunit